MSGTTLADRAEHVAVIRHSRFIAQAAPVDSPEAALAFLAQVADPAATHNCWAYRIGALYRFSDDNEPAGTAGRPILAAIDGQALDQVMAVVTRWFGGIKLGAGGLMRAYGGSASECLRLAPRAALIDYVDCELAFGFADTGAVHAALETHAAARLGEHFDAEGTRLTIRVPLDHVDALRVHLRDATRDRVRIDVPERAQR